MASGEHETDLEDEYDNSQDQTFIAPKSSSSKRVKFMEQEEKRHRTYTRHTTGVTQKEQRKRDQRSIANAKYTTSAVSLKEYVLDRIISHRIEGNGNNKQYKYLVSWEDPNIQPRYISVNDFCTKDILWDYWANIPRNQRPVAFQKTRPTTGQ